MGCWSESCAISGLEIPSGTKAYVAYLLPDPWRKDEGIFELVVPPILGEYNDYGSLEDGAETSIVFGIKDGHDFRTSFELAMDGHINIQNYSLRPIYIHAEIFDTLENIPCEFQYNGKNTIGDFADEHVAHLRKKIEVHKAKQASYVELTAKSNQSFRPMTIWLDGSDIMADFRGGLIDQLIEADDKAGGTEYVDEFLKLYRRAFVLKKAAMELRRDLSPNIVGPQHNGSEALEYFCKKTLDIIESDRKRRDE